MPQIQPAGQHAASQPSSGTKYLTIPFPRTTPLIEVLHRLATSKLTDDWTLRHKLFFLETWPPFPCLRSDLQSRKYSPRGFAAVPRSIPECGQMARAYVLEGRKLTKEFTGFRECIEEHFGPFLDSGCWSETTKVFQATLPHGTTDEARLVSNHEAARRKYIRILYDGCNEGRTILTTVGKRFEDIDHYTRKSISQGFITVMPPRLAQVFIDVSIWHQKVKAAMAGIKADWEEAQTRHEQHRVQRANTEETSGQAT